MKPYDLSNTSHRTARPTLTAENAVEYLDWTVANLRHMHEGELRAHLLAAELAIRTRMGDAQDKATQHTLVEDGVLKPPPAAPIAAS